MAQIYKWEEYTEQRDSVRIPVGVAEDGSIIREKLFRDDLEAWVWEGIPCELSPQALQQIIFEWIDTIWPSGDENNNESD
jgi:hypothetical protein